jgi:hypothetical protein
LINLEPKVKIFFKIKAVFGQFGKWMIQFELLSSAFFHLLLATVVIV